MEKNKKWIVIPDVHGRKFWRDAVNGKEKEKKNRFSFFR